MDHPKPAVTLAVLQRAVKASVLRYIPVPLAVLEAHLSPEEMEAVRSLVADVPTNRRDAE